MAGAEYACGEILFCLKQSNLNYVLNETPYSAYITIRKKFLKISEGKEKSAIKDNLNANSIDMNEKENKIKSLIEKNKALEASLACAKLDYEEMGLKVDLLEKSNLNKEEVIENLIKKDSIKTEEIEDLRRRNESLKRDVADICNLKNAISKEFKDFKNVDQTNYLEVRTH